METDDSRPHDPGTGTGTGTGDVTAADVPAPAATAPGEPEDAGVLAQCVADLRRRYADALGEETVDRQVLDSLADLTRTGTGRTHLEKMAVRFADSRLGALAEAEGEHVALAARGGHGEPDERGEGVVGVVHGRVTGVAGVLRGGGGGQGAAAPPDIDRMAI